jgi:methylenetetrahydrofolate dehydrogenase (NADP+)/methenyltetrahydrofolate cyclohydrolase
MYNKKNIYLEVYMGIWLEGKTLAKTERQKVEEEIAELKKSRNEVPGLAAILVGENKASQIYVRTKERSCVKN